MGRTLAPRAALAASPLGLGRFEAPSLKNAKATVAVVQVTTAKGNEWCVQYILLLSCRSNPKLVI